MIQIKWNKKYTCEFLCFRFVPKDCPKTSITCEGCMHLYYNGDGSVGCDSPYENVCLKTEDRAFKESGGKSMESWKERMINEYREVKDRYEKLHKMLVKYDAGKLEFTPSCPIDLLREQASVMGRYLYILEERACIEDIELV